ncbi:YeiH family protein [Marinobacterium arenosum]|uniref:YeiH family protein n=1 Tax=Marinobacterium arenosum TaxID=2862496 RepID=UPI001C958FD3|nr:YeiH family protein [Marinobacterium arenosum]MBY4677287.1 YeiH family protein [Marinobacterium arenosum]
MNLLIALPCIALSATLIAKIPAVAQFGLSALPLAIVIGIVFGHLNRQTPTEREVTFTRFCQQKLLRAGIILFGFSLSFQQILSVGWQALLLDAIVISMIFGIGTFVGVRYFKLHRDVAILTSAGSAICGAAAVLATESVLKARQQHVTVAVATVVLFGTLAMFSYPLIYQFAGMSEQAFGIYIGSTVHEVAQAVAAGEAVGGSALQNAVVVKLIRVMMLAPFILMLSTVLTRRSGEAAGGKITIPWFVFGFIAAAGINSLVALPTELLGSLQMASQFSLAIAMAALGTQTQWKTIRQAGSKPLILSLILFLLLIVGGFYLNQWLIPV